MSFVKKIGPEITISGPIRAQVGKREKFTNQFVEDLRLLANLNKFGDPFV